MAVEYMVVTINSSHGGGKLHAEALGFINDEEEFARSNDYRLGVPGMSDEIWFASFISRVLGDLGEDEWSLVTKCDPFSTHSNYFYGTFVLSRPR